ncbi:MAG: AAA family ATPase [Saccharofermentans sp.]|nr:AAA family ATPase [Saccharofermentans sp.]
MANVNNNNKDNEQAIRLDDILYIIVKHHKTMLGLAVLGLLVGVLISFAFYVKGLTKVEYYVKASIAVTSTNENGLFSANSSDPNAADIHLAEDMTDSVIYVIKSDTTLNAAAEKLSLIGVDADDIRPKLLLSQYEKTQIIEMTLVWDNAEEGMMILNAITDVVPDILISTLKLGDVSVVNPPKVSTTSLSFINMKIIAICFMLGLFAGCGFYLIRFFIHPTFLHSEDIVDRYNLEILGEIPGDKNYFATKINSFTANDFSTVQEYFAACAHVLVFKLQNMDNACVYITSSASKEGKTSITANVAYALSELGYKTLLMDMDVRNPSLSSKFILNTDEKHSLNAVYRGDIGVFDALVKINSNLDILPTRIENEPIRLDNKTVEIISSAKTEYDFVIIDTAPVGQVSDSMSLNQAADCAIFVVRQDQVWINTVTESINRLKKSGIELLGAIVNDTKGGSSNYYYYNYKEFGDSPYVNNPRKSTKGDNDKNFKIIDGKSILGEDYIGLTGRKKKLSEKRAEEEELRKAQESAEAEAKAAAEATAESVEESAVTTEVKEEDESDKGEE